MGMTDPSGTVPPTETRSCAAFHMLPCREAQLVQLCHYDLETVTSSNILPWPRFSTSPLHQNTRNSPSSRRTTARTNWNHDVVPCFSRPAVPPTSDGALDHVTGQAACSASGPAVFHLSWIYWLSISLAWLKPKLWSRCQVQLWEMIFIYVFLFFYWLSSSLTLMVLGVSSSQYRLRVSPFSPLYLMCSTSGTCVPFCSICLCLELFSLLVFKFTVKLKSAVLEWSLCPFCISHITSD